MSGSEGIMASAMLTQSVASVGSGYAQAKAYEMQGDYQRRMGELNAKLSEAQADDALKRGEKAVVQHKKQVKKLIGAQRTSLAAQGVELDSGSALDIQEESAQLGQIDALTIRNNAWREAWGFRTQALTHSAQGEFAGLAYGTQATSSLLTGGIQAAGYGMQSGYYLSKLPTKTPTKG